MERPYFWNLKGAFISALILKSHCTMNHVKVGCEQPTKFLLESSFYCQIGTKVGEVSDKLELSVDKSGHGTGKGGSFGGAVNFDIVLLVVGNGTFAQLLDIAPVVLEVLALGHVGHHFQSFAVD